MRRRGLEVWVGEEHEEEGTGGVGGSGTVHTHSYYFTFRKHSISLVSRTEVLV